MSGDERFKNVKSLSKLPIMLVATKKHTRHDIMYKLFKLVLVPVATASVHSVLSINYVSQKKYVKSMLRNRIRY